MVWNKNVMDPDVPFVKPNKSLLQRIKGIEATLEALSESIAAIEAKIDEIAENTAPASETPAS